ncbi:MULTISPECIES: hypothetical protein [Marinomonas]|uniref:hypothetical protein n=1 Tax=Marinomonas TaxID=28253 RepID=UPI00105669D0|nr:hypothetical protein [Marinomonas flavescens]
MVEKDIIYVRANNAGSTAGIIACVLAVFGIFTLSVVFVPLAIIFAIFGTLAAILQMNGSGIGVNLLAWILVIAGIVTSPALIAFILMIGGLIHLTP